jgi:hypothetical protein
MSARYINVALERSPVGVGFRKVAQWVEYSDFTDNASTGGTLVLTPTIPAGSFVFGSKVTVVTGFTGGTNTTAVMDIGDGSDADLFSYTTHNIYTAATNLVEGCDSAAAGNTGTGIAPVAAETSITLTATVSADWTTISAGKMLVEVFYFSTNVELTETYPNKHWSSI